MKRAGRKACPFFSHFNSGICGLAHFVNGIQEKVKESKSLLDN